jgi:UDP-N-acetylglucosamine--N-acetylmuramyl-(pentapeptide) pyrophosphoryl-undecaprenol N-acetylglucosamine transferase
MEMDLVKRASVPFSAIPAAGLHGVGLRALPTNLWQLARGYFASRKILQDFQPDVLFFTGGYVAVPMALAGRRCPTLVYIPDIEPGLAIKLCTRFADRIATSTPETAAYLDQPDRMVVTGYPTRPDLSQWTREHARTTLGLAHDRMVILAFGGSRGARSINHSLFEHLPQLLEMAQVVHITGSLDWVEVDAVRKNLTRQQNADYFAYPYLHEEMGAALAAADLAISRSGASTLGEYPLFGLPAILVPYPYAWRYQKVNADYLVKNGAAFLIEDWSLPVELIPTVRRLIENPERLQAMKEAMRSLAVPDAGAVIANQLLDLHRQQSSTPAHPPR